MPAASQVPVRELLAAGLQLFPVQKAEKPPRDEGWRTRDYSPEELEAWVAEGGNLGVRLLPGQLVLDWDVRADIIGDSLDRLIKDGGLDAGFCFTVRTPTGGLHVYVTVPKDARIRGNLNRFGYPGVDMKKSGGYVLAPGCVHPSHLDGPLYSIEGVATPLARPDAPAALLALISKPSETVEERARAKASMGGTGGTLSPKWLRRLLDKLDPEDFRSYEDWSELLRAVHHGTAGGPDGLLAFTEWSVRAAGYEHAAENIEQHWESYRADEDGGTTVATLFHYVKEACGTIPVQPAEEVFSALPEEQVRASESAFAAEAEDFVETDRQGRPLASTPNSRVFVKRLGLVARYDQLRDNILVDDPQGVFESSGFKGMAGKMLTDAMVLALVAKILPARGFGAARKENVRDALVALGHENSFNPVTDWLETLHWDGKPRLDSWLHRYLGAVDTPLHAAFGRLTLVGAVARAYQPGIKFDTALVLEGEQGVGKSQSIMALAPKESRFVHEGLPAGELRSKDVVDALRGAWLIEMDEMDSLKRAEVTSLKSFLSRTTDRARLAYRVTTEDFPRRCIFICTTNEADYLLDHTGARRFWPVRVGVVAEVQAKAIARDRAQLWAEAVALWREDQTPEALTLDPSLWGSAAEQTQRRTVVDPWLGTIQRAMDSEKWKRATRISTDEVLTFMLGKDPAQHTSQDARRIAQMMPALGWQKHRTRSNNGWKRDLPLHDEEPEL